MTDPVRALLEEAAGLLREVKTGIPCHRPLDAWGGADCGDCPACRWGKANRALLARFDALPCRECQGIAWESASDSQAVRAVVLCPACKEDR